MTSAAVVFDKGDSFELNGCTAGSHIFNLQFVNGDLQKLLMLAKYAGPFLPVVWYKKRQLIMSNCIT